MAMSYNLGSNVSVLYLDPDFWSKVTSLPIPSRKDFESGGGIIWASSRCAPERTGRMAERLKLVKIDSRGACLNNAPRLPPGHESLVLPYYSQYKVVIGFEKFTDQDYITEKFFYPYLGPK